MHSSGIGGTEPAGKTRPLPVRGRAVAALISLILFPLCDRPADAAPWTLLKLQNLAQGVAGSYHYSGNSTSSEGGGTISSSAQQFREAYHLSGEFALLNPRIINGSANLDLNLNQRRESERSGRTGSASSFTLGYQLSSNLFDRTSVPLSVNAYSLSGTQTPAFSSAFDLESEGLDVTLMIKNRYLPARLSWGNSASQTSGLADDRRQSANSFSMTAQHVVPALSNSNFSFYRTNSHTELLTSGSKSDSADAGVGVANSLDLRFGGNLTRALDSSYSYAKSGGIFAATRHNLTSTFRSALGRALNGSAGYSFATSQTDTQLSRQHTGTLSLSHRLFDSLSTSISGSGSNSTYNDGSDSIYSGSLGLSYSKRLSSASSFGLSYNFGYAVSDRAREDTVVQVQSERHAIPPADPRLIAVANSTFQGDTLVVIGAQTLITYNSGIDFIVTQTGIEVLPGRMVGDSELLISYSYLQDPLVSFASIGHGAGARLNLHNNRHSLYSHYFTTSQQLLRGSATNVTLFPTTHLDAGFESRIDLHTCGAEYAWDKNYAGNVQYLKSYWLYQGPLFAGTIHGSANDRLAWLAGSSTRGKSSWENSLNLGATYNRSLSQAIAGKLGLGYRNYVSEASPMANSFSVSANLDGRFGKTAVTVSSSLTWSKSSSAWSQSESVGVSLRRTF